MPIKCQICEREFAKQITNSHLKTHTTTTTEYKLKYGNDSLSSAEYRLERSQANSGKNNPNYGTTWTDDQKIHLSDVKKGTIPWNKGLKITDEIHLESIRDGIERREEKYETGEMMRYAHKDISAETKEKISKSIKQYARLNPEEMKQRAAKALGTKLENGYDFITFTGPHTEETKIKISDNSKKVAAVKKEQSQKIKKELAESANMTILNFNENVCNIRCNHCNTEFSFTSQYFTDSKFFKEMCSTCYPRDIKRSKAEKEIYHYIKTLCPDAIHSNRVIISPKELDIVIPSLRLAIEYNGCYWHCEEANRAVSRPVKMDSEKLKLVEEADYRLITIYDDEYINTPDIVKSRLAAICGKNSNKIFARKTKIQEIDSKTANTFLKTHHIQGSGRSNVRLGLYHNEVLVSVMTFSKSNISRRIEGWELNRFCHKAEYIVVGGASKMFKYFVKQYDPVKVISYADRRWSQGGVYCQLGFSFVHNTPPNYWYIQPNTPKRIHRYSLRKNENDDRDLTEYENRLAQGYNRIWDCGSSKWEWTSK